MEIKSCNHVNQGNKDFTKSSSILTMPTFSSPDLKTEQNKTKQNQPQRLEVDLNLIIFYSPMIQLSILAGSFPLSASCFFHWKLWMLNVQYLTSVCNATVVTACFKRTFLSCFSAQQNLKQ